MTWAFICTSIAIILKFIYSEKAAKFCEVFTLLTEKVKISQNLTVPVVSFSESFAD